jgi:hypothetical protein
MIIHYREYFVKEYIQIHWSGRGAVPLLTLHLFNRFFPASIQIILRYKTEFFLDETAVNGNIFGIFVNDRPCNRWFYTNGVASFFN